MPFSLTTNLLAQINAVPKFDWVNYSVVGLYLLVLVWLGFRFSQHKDTNDYFRAGQRIPWWAAGVSIFGTQLSAITFMAIPAKTYATDWSYLTFNLTILLVAPVVTALFIPLFHRLSITTAYEYLEDRFNLTARLLGSGMFILLQLGRIGIVLLLPSLALNLVTGVDVFICIVIMGVLSIIYTVLGGIEAVIWTDVLQVVVLLGGAILSLILIVLDLDGGYNQLLSIAHEADKLQAFDFRFDWAETTVWVMLLGGLGSNLISYGSDQTVVQRYLTTKDEASARRSIWTSALLSVPATLIFFSLGTALFVFYKASPEELEVSLTNTDAIFPYYIVTQLPRGVSGLLIAGIFAAAMSSLDSSMNSIATVVTTDFFRRFRRMTEAASMRLAKGATTVVGVTGTLFALAMATWEIQSLWDQLNLFIGLFAGGLGGIFLLGMTSNRANGQGAVVGLISSGVILLLVKVYTTLSFLLYAAIGVASCMMIGYVVSLLYRNDHPEKLVK